MARIIYKSKKFAPASMAVIRKAQAVLEEYADQGYDLTLRQLYYQFVKNNWIPNKQSEYSRLGSIINDARLSGYIDWDHIVDRTRNVRQPTVWDSPDSIIEAVSEQYIIDLWESQPNYVEVWIEKDALVGVIEGICNKLRVPHFSCRGYTSQSEMWHAAQRIGKRLQQEKPVRILHLGDHDPSGIDMTRDIFERMWLFMATDMYHNGTKSVAPDSMTVANATTTTTQLFKVERIALNMDQVEQYNPPPNPAKLTDSRAVDYIERHGNSSWELDALEPDVLTALIQDNVDPYRDPDIWNEGLDRERFERGQLRLVSKRWDDVISFVEGDAHA